MILHSKELVVERTEVVWKALRRFRDTSADFADCRMERSASTAGCPPHHHVGPRRAKHYGVTLVQ